MAFNIRKGDRVVIASNNTTNSIMRTRVPCAATVQMVISERSSSTEGLYIITTATDETVILSDFDIFKDNKLRT